MKRSQALARVLGVVASSAAPRCALAANATLRIATLPIDPAACSYYGQDLGFFQAAGIDAQIQVIQSGAAVIAALVSGAIDVGWSSPISVASAYLRGLPIRIVAAGGLYVQHRETTGIIVAKNSPMRGARDVEGKTLAVDTLRTAGELSTRLWMSQNGADPSKLSVVEIPFPEMPQALIAGRVDAASSAEPFITEARGQVRFFADTFAAIAPRFCLGCWVSTPQWVDAHRDAVATFDAVVAKAGAWANSHQNESAAILSKYTGLDLAITRSMVRCLYGTRLLADEVQPPIDLAVRYGLLASPVRAESLLANV